MLMPKRVKRRRVHRGRMTGKANKGNTIAYGQYGLVLGLGMQQSDSNVWTSLVAQLGENLPAVQEIQVQSLSRESPCFFFFPSPF